MINMEWLFWLSVAVFLIYNTVIIMRYGVPVSLSETFYLMPKKYGKHIFLMVFTLIGLPLMIFGTEISPETFPSEFAIFFCGSFFIAVAVAAEFKEKFVEKYHIAFAMICAALSIVWTGFTYIIGLVVFAFFAAIFIPIGLKTKGVRRNRNGDLRVDGNSKTYFLELICFFGLYICMMLYYYKVLI